MEGLERGNEKGPNGRRAVKPDLERKERKPSRELDQQEPRQGHGGDGSINRCLLRTHSAI